MSTTNGTGPAPAAPRAGPTWYTVPEAAAQLGLKERAVRKRIAAGTLEAQRTAQGWRVALSAAPGPAPTAPSTGTGPAPENDLVDALRGEVAFLRGELEAQRERHTSELAAWQERLREAHVLLVQRALPASVTPAPPTEAGSWWARLAWWRR